MFVYLPVKNYIIQFYAFFSSLCQSFVVRLFIFYFYFYLKPALLQPTSFSRVYSLVAVFYLVCIFYLFIIFSTVIIVPFHSHCTVVDRQLPGSSSTVLASQLLFVKLSRETSLLVVVNRSTRVIDAIVVQFCVTRATDNVALI